MADLKNPVTRPGFKTGCEGVIFSSSISYNTFIHFVLTSCECRCCGEFATAPSRHARKESRQKREILSRLELQGLSLCRRNPKGPKGKRLLHYFRSLGEAVSVMRVIKRAVPKNRSGRCRETKGLLMV
jgi:hypothetical protein